LHNDSHTTNNILGYSLTCVAWWCRTHDQEVAGSTPGHCIIR